MDHLVNIKNSVLHYLSPSGKRRRTINPSTTPDTREHAYAVPYSDPQDKRALAAAASRFNASYTPGDNPRKRAREEDNGSLVFSVDPDDSISQITPGDDHSEASGATSEEPPSEDAADDEMELEDYNQSNHDIYMKIEEEEVSGMDKVADFLARQEQERAAELERIRKNIEEFRLEGKHPDEIFLYERLHMRGHEELLPSDWQIDLPTLPVILFTPDPSKSFVNSNCSPSSHGRKALQSLLGLGVRVRDNRSCGAPIERLFAREIKSYMKWAERDGGYAKLRFIPVLTLVIAKPGQSTDAVSNELKSQMKFLAERHRNHLAVEEEHINEVGELVMYSRPPPLLYGIVVMQTVAVFFTLNSADPNADLRVLTHAPFEDKKMDVWNEFAIALTVIVARNYMMSIKDELEPDSEDSDLDPDA